MQFTKEENKQLCRIVDIILKEALWDYTYSGDMSVVVVNSQPLIFNKEQLAILDNIKQKLELNKLEKEM